MESVIFDSPFLLFAPNLVPFVRADDVGYTVSQFMSQEGLARFPIGALTETKVARVCLDCRQRDEIDEDNLAVIFRMPLPGGVFSFEIVIRTDNETFYAGSIEGGQLQILDNGEGGYRSLRCTNATVATDYSFSTSSKRFEPLNKSESS